MYHRRDAAAEAQPDAHADRRALGTGVQLNHLYQSIFHVQVIHLNMPLPSSMFRHSPEHPLSAMFRSFVHYSAFYVQLFCCTEQLYLAFDLIRFTLLRSCPHINSAIRKRVAGAVAMDGLVAYSEVQRRLAKAAGGAGGWRVIAGRESGNVRPIVNQYPGTLGTSLG